MKQNFTDYVVLIGEHTYFINFIKISLFVQVTAPRSEFLVPYPSLICPIGRENPLVSLSRMKDWHSVIVTSFENIEILTLLTYRSRQVVNILNYRKHRCISCTFLLKTFRWHVQETWRNSALTCKASLSRLHFWFILISFKFLFSKSKLLNSGCSLSASAAYKPVFTVFSIFPSPNDINYEGPIHNSRRILLFLCICVN